MVVAQRSATATHEITLLWDAAGNFSLPDLPATVNVGETVRFSSPSGPVTVVFLSPFGDPTITLTENDIATLKRGGIYHFACALTGQPPVDEGGVIDIVPHK